LSPDSDLPRETVAETEIEAQHDRDLYTHAVKLAEMFLEWRHRVMRFTFTAVSALVALSAWMYDHDLRRAIAGPLLLGGVIAGAAFMFDRRNQTILSASYRNSEVLAKRLGAPDGGPLSWVPKRVGSSIPTYHSVLWLLYGLIAGTLIACAGVALFSSPKPPKGSHSTTTTTTTQGAAPAASPRLIALSHSRSDATDA
jgi:hypothetical protein